ncbi:Uncharacterized membrane protein [Caloramator fervidus]|uniref:Uncharacterized membrane protein n=1 Tax=Caloramator fervidus TaxID=29344 RepID=A0A1H5RRX8_9CLOT|nr:heparan-alpha-glucosaminide N-acetyltransferase [Caloramator fervidus]SEF40271.1 Uncharacterized membrane protein [Caloramator fervidus]
MKKRIFEIDLLRFIAIFLMILYHLAYDVQYYLGKYINFEGLGWTFIGKTASFLFILVSGISSGFSKNNIKRGIKTFAWGLVVTFFTFIFLKEEYVRFGILHFLGLCMMIYPFLYNINSIVLLILSFVSLYLSLLFKKITINTFLFLPFGLYYKGFSSIDYFPIFPYISIYILGIIIYKNFYEKGKTLFKIKIGFIEYISQKSLVIYLIHQPILLGIIYLIKLLRRIAYDIF